VDRQLQRRPEQLRDAGDPAGAADQVHGAQRRPVHTGRLDHPACQLDHPQQIVGHQGLELGPGQRRRLGGARRQQCGLVAAEQFLGGAGVLAHQQLRPPRLVVGGRLRRRPHPVDDPLVEVVAAEVRQPGARQYREPGAVPPDHRGVGGTATEVDHEHRGAVGEPGPRGDGDRLRHEAQPGRQTGGGAGQPAHPHRAPVGRVGQHQVVDRPARLPGRGRADPGQHRPHRRQDVDRGLAEQEGVLVESCLGPRLQPVWRGPAEPQRVRADDEPAVVAEEHRRRQLRRAVHTDHPRRGPVPPGHRDGVGGAEVDGDGQCTRAL
jgi:hypothetical protein